MKKEVNIIFSESWLRMDIGSINELLTETINEFVEEEIANWVAVAEVEIGMDSFVGEGDGLDVGWDWEVEIDI